jgi:twinkle protein
MIPIELADDICERGLRLYDEGLPRGSSTGWRGLDELYTVGTGQWTLITGIPHSGKSEWLDALMVNLAESDNWDFALYSPENYPTEIHLSKLAEKRVRRPFGPGPTQRMTREEFDTASAWICDHFIWLAPEYKDHISLLEAAQMFGSKRDRKFGVVLDPWNTLEHFRPRDLTETEYVSMALTDITNWCRQKRCHIFVVAHPSKLARGADGKRPVPTPYDIAGSAHWYNKADNIITVHRDQSEARDQHVEIHVQKVRFKHMGRIGLAEILYDRITGRYRDRPPLHIVAQYAD